MAKKSALLNRVQQTVRNAQYEARVHTRVWVLDIVTITLGQMGFTPEDLEHFRDEYMKTELDYAEEINLDYNENHDKRLDYAADKIDRVLKQYVSDDMFVPFDERHAHE